MWNSWHSTHPRPNPSLYYLLSDAYLQKSKVLTHQREKTQCSSSWAQWNNNGKIPSLNWRWESVYSNIYFVIYQSQQTIIRLSWGQLFSGEVMQQFKMSQVMCWWDSQHLPAFSFQTRGIFHCSFFWKIFTFSNYNTVITQCTNLCNTEPGVIQSNGRTDQTFCTFIWVREGGIANVFFNPKGEW